MIGEILEQILGAKAGSLGCGFKLRLEFGLRMAETTIERQRIYILEDRDEALARRGRNSSVVNLDTKADAPLHQRIERGLIGRVEFSEERVVGEESDSCRPVMSAVGVEIRGAVSFEKRFHTY